jgi:hypothetical protein
MRVMKRRPTCRGPYHQGLDQKTLVFINFSQGERLPTTLIVSAGLLALGVAQSQTTTGTAPKVNVGPTVAAKSNSPAPSATAKNQSQKSSVGKGATSVKSSAPASFWTDRWTSTMTAPSKTTNSCGMPSAACFTPTAKMISPAPTANPKPARSSWVSTPRATRPESPWGPGGTWWA